MRLSKALLKNSAVLWLLSFLASLYIRFVYYTTSWQWQMPDETRDYLASGKPAIFVFWHGRLLMQSCFRPKRYNISVVISRHKDGEAITRVMRFFGVGAIRGSSSKGGVQALKECFSYLETPGNSLAITPDGPRGPRMRLQGNLIEIAKRSGVAIILSTYSASRAHVFSSWDRFMLPKPFGKGIVILDKPFYIAKDANQTSMDEVAYQLEHRLNAMTQEADMAMGREPVGS